MIVYAFLAGIAVGSAIMFMGMFLAGAFTGASKADAVMAAHAAQRQADEAPEDAAQN